MNVAILKKYSSRTPIKLFAIFSIFFFIIYSHLDA